MKRWDLRKIFGRVSLADFKTAIDAMKTGMEPSCGAVKVNITAYNGLKESITSWDDGLQAFIDERNSLKVISTVDSNELTNSLWDQATYIEATLRPENPAFAPASAFGHIEAKGLLSSTLNFYVQADDQSDTIAKSTNAPFRFWRQGGGYKSNHIVSYR